MKKIVTRFAPSPTGYLHIGSARTALFNYLFSRANQGKFLLRIEDTDRARSTDEAIEAIFKSLNWLGIQWDEKEVYQFSRAQRHRQVAEELLAKGKAYKCFLSPHELDGLREETFKTGKPIRSPWREADPASHPHNTPYVIRIKAPQIGRTIIEDKVQGRVITENSTLDDMVLLRSDGTPTYMLAVVVDDHDMEVTHIIRGDDHLSNTPRQITIYEAMGWEVPIFAHIPLIHGEDGKKLSKRHGALGVESYKEMGYLPETICNYLLRLGWSHGDDEIISADKAIEWFNLESIGKSPSRLDFKKLDNLNNHYLKLLKNEEILDLLEIKKISIKSKGYILKGLDSLKHRAKTLEELKSTARIYIIEENIEIPDEMKVELSAKLDLVKEFSDKISEFLEWNKESLMQFAKDFAEVKSLKLADVAGFLRIILTGSNASPSVFEIMSIIGKEDSLRRILYVLNSSWF